MLMLCCLEPPFLVIHQEICLILICIGGCEAFFFPVNLAREKAVLKGQEPILEYY